MYGAVRDGFIARRYTRFDTTPTSLSLSLSATAVPARFVRVLRPEARRLRVRHSCIERPIP